MSQQTTPYIGSKISLISKLDIRYEGILYTVDTNESTIALAKVRSFGTENRPTSNPVQARNDVYDYIIFKASDIKDLIVCDTPKPVAQLSSGLAYDPAILTISSNSQPAPTTNAALISAGSSRSDTPHQVTGGVGDAQPEHLTSRAPGAGRAARGGPGLESEPSLVAPLKQGARQVPVAQPQQNYRNMGGAGQHGGAFVNQQHNNYRAGQQRTGGGGGYYQRGYMGGYQRGQRSGIPNKAVSPKERFKFETDYDFEKANEQFQETLNNITQDLKKTKIEGDGGSEKESTGSDAGPDVIEEGEIVENEEDETADNYYDKSSSFFDRISCEALEKQEGKQPRTDWRKERETNQQTFGHSAVRSLAYRRGRGYQGGRNMRGGNAMFRYNNGYNNYGGQRGGFNYYPNGYHRRGGYRPNFVQQ